MRHGGLAGIIKRLLKVLPRHFGRCVIGHAGSFDARYGGFIGWNCYGFVAGQAMSEEHGRLAGHALHGGAAAGMVGHRMRRQTMLKKWLMLAGMAAVSACSGGSQHYAYTMAAATDDPRYAHLYKAMGSGAYQHDEFGW